MHWLYCFDRGFNAQKQIHISNLGASFTQLQCLLIQNRAKSNIKHRYLWYAMIDTDELFLVDDESTRKCNNYNKTDYN